MVAAPDDVPPTLPSTPDPETVALVTALIRHILSIASGIGLSVGVYSDSTLTLIASSLIAVAMASWSLWQKFESARTAHTNTVLSAVAQAPVKAAS